MPLVTPVRASLPRSMSSQAEYGRSDQGKCKVASNPSDGGTKDWFLFSAIHVASLAHAASADGPTPPDVEKI